MMQSTFLIDLSDISFLSALTVVIVQLIKNLFKKNIPTQFVTLITGIIITIIFTFSTMDIAIGFFSVITAILNGCVVSFIAMNGFDAFRDIWNRFTINTVDRG